MFGRAKSAASSIGSATSSLIRGGSKEDHGFKIFAASVPSAASSFVRGGSKQDHGFKMLLIGETGSGKTSFLNLLWNNGKIHELGYSAHQLERFNDIKLENAEAGAMESKTMGAKLYNVALCDLKIGVIDSPGFGDTRGLEEDKKNAKIIVEALKSEEYINCICLVINGRTSRMTAILRYVLTEITAILPRVVLDNVIVVLTNTSNPLLCSFKSATLKDFFGKEIDKKQIFYVENPYCHLEKAKEMEESLSHDTIVGSLKSAFNETADILKEMHSVIKDFKCIHTHHFSWLYEMKQEIERKVLGLLTEYDYQMKLERQIAIAEERVTRASRSKELHADYKSTQEIKRWKQVSTKRHNTLCGARGCYSNCHVPCRLDKSFDKEEFRKCASMGGGKTCIECGHLYKLHYHNEVVHELEVVQHEMIDEKSKKKFEEAKSMEDREHIYIAGLNESQNKSEQKRKALSYQLLSTIEEFQKLGVNRNYTKVLQNQLTVVEHLLEGAADDEEIKHLNEVKQTIEKKLKVVKETLEEPWSEDADPEAKRKWACKILGVLPSSDKATIEHAYKMKSKVYHPDKEGGDTDQFKRIVKARDILIGQNSAMYCIGQYSSIDT